MIEFILTVLAVVICLAMLSLAGWAVWIRDRHQHTWKTTQQEFVPSGRKITKVNGYIDGELAMVIHGYTMITQVCTGCGEIKATRHIGKVTV